MMNNENDPFYILEDEKMEEKDNSPLNFAAYEDDEREENEIEEALSEAKEVNGFALLFKIMFNPVEGWKLLRRSKTTVENLQSGCFYPLLAILAVAEFADFFYSVNVSLSTVVTKAIIGFVSYFLGYFCILMIMSWVLPKDMHEKFDCKYGKEYIIISLSTLAFFSIFTEILPMLWPILIFLPIWTLYLMFKGVRFFKFYPHQEMKFFVITGFVVIGMPYMLDWVLNTLLQL